MKYGYYPGCSLLGSAKEYADSSEAVLEAMEIELEEVEDWVCCGATPAHATSHLLSIALPAISCAAAEKQNLDILSCCTACYSRLKQANYAMQQDPELLSQVNEVIEEDYQGKVKVQHIIEVLASDSGLDAVRARVEKPLEGLKVACYYGCLIARLPEELAIVHAEYPMLMDNLVEAVGAEAVEWPYKTECCGAGLTLARGESVVRLSGEILKIAKENGADVLAVACPLCQANLDMYQDAAEKMLGERLGLPIMYFSQVVGLGLGIDPERLALNKLIVDPMPVLTEKGFVEGEVYL